MIIAVIRGKTSLDFIKMADGLYLTRCPEDVEPIGEGMERVCEKLHKILL